LYELTMTLQAGAKQKLQLKLSDLDFVESIWGVLNDRVGIAAANIR
jgi:hypothetical protein